MSEVAAARTEPKQTAPKAFFSPSTFSLVMTRTGGEFSPPPSCDTHPLTTLTPIPTGRDPAVPARSDWPVRWNRQQVGWSAHLASPPLFTLDRPFSRWSDSKRLSGNVPAGMPGSPTGTNWKRSSPHLDKMVEFHVFLLKQFKCAHLNLLPRATPRPEPVLLT